MSDDSHACKTGGLNARLGLVLAVIALLPRLPALALQDNKLKLNRRPRLNLQRGPPKVALGPLERGGLRVPIAKEDENKRTAV